MARIKIEDLSNDRELDDDDLDRIAGGLSLSFNQTTLLKSTNLYGSYSIGTIPLPGITVAGVRG